MFYDRGSEFKVCIKGCVFLIDSQVIYIAVTDFLQKREGEKFEKEEAAKKKKKSGKKGRGVRAGARGGPRGFGQKIEEDDDDFGQD